jgi:hypothetical protein
MITNGDDNMADVSKDCDQPEDDEPILDFELDEYDRLLLENPNFEEELLAEEGPESQEQPEYYMNIQDLEPPWEALEKLMLESTVPLLGDVTISDAPYETSDEVRI